MRNSRWKTDPKLDENGKPERIVFGQSDLEICKLLAAGSEARHPWSYQYLPTSYFSALLNRGRLTKRLFDLARRPSYIRKPEQPRNNYRELIYALDTRGVDELRDSGVFVTHLRERKLPHELMRCICAASFEIGAAERGLPIIVEDFAGDLRPDWPVFQLAGHRVFLEADVASETLDSRRPNTTTIGGKFEEYLKLIHDRRLKDALVLFVTTRISRRDSMIDLLRTVIDKNRFDRELARHFGFTAIEYDKFLDRIPKPSGWAVTGEWQRASRKHGPFKFVQ